MANEAKIPITVENLDMSTFCDSSKYVACVGCVYGDIGYAAIKWPGQAGLEAVSAMARGSERRISLRSTAVRMVATWLITIGLAPVGRESAIIESGGAIGSTLGRRFGGRGATAAAAGIAAAFAAASAGAKSVVRVSDKDLPR